MGSSDEKKNALLVGLSLGIIQCAIVSCKFLQVAALKERNWDASKIYFNPIDPMNLRYA